MPSSEVKDSLGESEKLIEKGKFDSFLKTNYSKAKALMFQALDEVVAYAKSKNIDILSVNLKYADGLPVIKEIKRVSKPGRRIYARADSISKIQNGLGLSIVSTSKGIMTDNDARNKKIGGEIICKVF